jgi:phospholipase C
MRFPLRSERFSSRPSGRRPVRLSVVACLSLVGAAVCAGATTAAAQPSAAAVPRLNHVFVIVEENNGFHDVIGNRAAPNLNALARTFGLATDYFGVSHPSEPNYVGLLGGNTFGVNSDDAYWTHEVRAPSLISQLDHAGISWKAYLQGSPHPGYQGICYPAKCNGAPDSDPLFVSKHDGIQNYVSSLNPLDWSRQVPIGELPGDLASGNVPRFSYVVPDECHDMHGDPPYCLDGGNIGTRTVYVTQLFHGGSLSIVKAG